MKKQIVIFNTIIFLFLVTLANGSFAQQNTEFTDKTFADEWEYVGVAVKEPGYTIWGTSPIIDNNGKVHLFVARWLGNTVSPGWVTHSEIAHYVGDLPEGPFVFSEVAVKGGNDKGKVGKAPRNHAIHKEKNKIKYAPHNPTIHKVDNLYVLVYITNEGGENPIPSQHICMSVSESLYGPWKKVGVDGVILTPPKNKDYWNYKASNGVNNPAFLQHPNGGYFLYFKSKNYQMGLAVAENLEGPYVQMPFSVTDNDLIIEDGYAFMYKGKFALITTDNHGTIEKGGGLLWTSDDGIHFDTYEKGFHRMNGYMELDMSKVSSRRRPGEKRTTYAKFERPQILLDNGEPEYLYVASGSNIFNDQFTVSYILKRKKEDKTKDN